MSFDCFINDLNIFFGSSQYIMKSFLTCMLIVPLILLFFVIFTVLKLIRKKTLYFRGLVVILITIMYNQHPTITEKVLSIFRCVNIDDVSRVKYDLNLLCWQGS